MHASFEQLQRQHHLHQAWFHLAMAVVQAEFPDWELLRAFNIFELTKERKQTRNTQLADKEGDYAMWRFVQRLAHVFTVDPVTLSEQIGDTVPSPGTSILR